MTEYELTRMDRIRERLHDVLANYPMHLSEAAKEMGMSYNTLRGFIYGGTHTQPLQRMKIEKFVKKYERKYAKENPDDI